MARSGSPCAADIRAIFLLVGECRDLGDDPAAWRQHLIAGAARLSGASAGIASDCSWDAPRIELGVTDLITWGLPNGFDAQALVRLRRAISLGGLSIDPMYAPFLVALRRQGAACLTRADMIPDREWYGSSFFQDYHQPTGADAILYCVHPVAGEGRMVALKLVRPRRQPDFTRRGRAVVQELHAQVAPLVGGALADSAEPSPADLPLRLRRVLRCLLEGDSDKHRCYAVEGFPLARTKKCG